MKKNGGMLITALKLNRLMSTGSKAIEANRKRGQQRNKRKGKKRKMKDASVLL